MKQPAPIRTYSENAKKYGNNKRRCQSRNLPSLCNSRRIPEIRSLPLPRSSPTEMRVLPRCPALRTMLDQGPIALHQVTTNLPQGASPDRGALLFAFVG